MRHLAAAIAAALAFEDHDAAERRRDQEFRDLHRRPDAPPDPVEPVRPWRRWQVTGVVVRRHRPVADGG